jgi:glycosyltransferase involved in cell wall biosynthesis
MSLSSEFTVVSSFSRTTSDPLFVSVIMPVRNESTRLLSAIRSIVDGRSASFPLQIVVVNDCSSDGCCSTLGELRWDPPHNVEVTVVELPRWSGIPYARNVGALRARADILFITDANVHFPQDWDLPIRRHITPDCALCATIADENSSFQACGGLLHFPSMAFSWLGSPAVFGGRVPLAPCTGTILPRSLFCKIGGYDTGMPLYGAAEPEFSVRLWLSGAEIHSMPQLKLMHRFRPSSERQPFLDAIRLTQIHNYLRFGMLYLDRANAMRVVSYYAASAPEFIDAALKRVMAGDVWHRRNLLRKRLPLSFESFLKRFGFLDARGRFQFG